MPTDNQIHKKPIALRFNPVLLARIDEIRPMTNFHTRTDLIETAVAVYLEYLCENLNEEAADPIKPFRAP